MTEKVIMTFKNKEMVRDEKGFVFIRTIEPTGIERFLKEKK